MNPFDLQVHTTASDGKHSPSECVRIAKENGCSVIAITDHDSVAGVAEAIAAGTERGVTVLAGVEISIQEQGMHLLGIGVDHEHKTLAAVLGQAAQNRIIAAKQMVENFQKDGFAVSWEDVLNEAGEGASIIARPHIVGAILNRPENKTRLAGIKTKYEFFQKFFTDASPYYVRGSTITPEEAIATVHRAGGIAVWSHPTVPNFSGNCVLFEDFLKRLLPAGLDGIELLSPALEECDLPCLERVGGTYALVSTAGSDFHEQSAASGPWPRPAATIGDYPTYGRALGGMLERVLGAIEKRRSSGQAR